MVVDLFFLFLFHDFLNIELIYSVYLAYSISFLVSFLLQKFWTFQNNDKKRTHKQFIMYMVVGITALNLNSYFVHLLVTKYEVFYLIAQFSVAIIFGTLNFIIYRFIIFKEKKYWKKNIKNILITTGIFPPDTGGPASYVNILCNELPKRGYKLRIITYSDLQPKECRKQKKNGYILYKISRQQGLLKRYFLYFRKVWRHLYWADIVYTQGPVSEGLPTYLACFLRRRKYILKVVGDYAWEQGSRRYNVDDALDNFQSKNYSFEVEIMRFIQKTVATRASIVITPSNYLKTIVNTWGVSNEKIKVVYNTVNSNSKQLTKIDAKSKIGESKDIILSMGRMVPWKGFDVLIQTMPELLKINSNFKLIIIGDGSEKERLANIIQELHLSKYVELKHSMAQIDFFNYLFAADMFILNTRYEGLSHVIIEAMKFGVPVATTNTCGNPELIKNNENGLLFEYNNMVEIKSCAEQLHKNKTEVEGYVDRSRLKIAKMFSKEKMISNTIEYFNQVFK